jgi:hypothetical protein
VWDGERRLKKYGELAGSPHKYIIDNAQLVGASRIFGQVPVGSRELETRWFILFVDLFVNSYNPVPVSSREPEIATSCR